MNHLHHFHHLQGTFFAPLTLTQILTFKILNECKCQGATFPQEKSFKSTVLHQERENWLFLWVIKVISTNIYKNKIKVMLCECKLFTHVYLNMIPIHPFKRPQKLPLLIFSVLCFGVTAVESRKMGTSGKRVVSESEQVDRIDMHDCSWVYVLSS